MTGNGQKAPPEYLPSSGGETFPQLLIRNATLFAGRDAMREKSFGIWRSWNWRELLQQVSALAHGLSQLGIQRGDRVVLIGDNRPRLYWSMSALQVLGAVPVPLFADISPPEMTARLARVKARFAIVEGQEEVDKLLAAMAGNSSLVAILYDKARGMRRYSESFLHALDDIQERGAAAAAPPAWIEGEIAAGRTDDPAIVLFTSGATGEPKPVLLSHELLIRSGHALATEAGLTERDQVLAYLPLAWYADHIPSFVQAHIAGYCVSCPESGDTVLNDLREIGPTYFIAPSRLFERVYRDAMARMADAGRLKRWLLVLFARHRALSGALPAESKRGVPATRPHGLLGEALIRGPLRNALGLSRMRTIYAVGDALSQSADQFYRMIGIDVRRCYTVLEAGGFVAVQAEGAASGDDLGPPLRGVEIQVNEAGELLIRGPALFLGYDGEDSSGAQQWFASGDAGSIDGSENIVISGRTSALGRLENGTSFAPEFIEARLRTVPEIAEAIVLGRGRVYCAAMLCLETSVMRALAEADGAERQAVGDYSWLGPGYDLLQSRIEALNLLLAGDGAHAPLQIKRFLVMPREFSVAAGEVTRSRQLRRHKIKEKFAGLIEALYAEAPGFAAWHASAADEAGPDRLEIRAVPEAR